MSTNSIMAFEKKKIIFSALMGNALEWFDFAIYGYLGTVLSTQFFPTSNKFTSLLLTYSVFAIGFFARPLGAILFGYMGDRYGRKTALISSSLCMSFPTLAIGFLPNYESVGVLASLLLIFCRILQGISLGGEFTNSFIYLVEKAMPKEKGFMSCFADLGCSLGMILGSLFVAFLYRFYTTEEIQSYAWRLPFLTGFLLAFVALYIRRHLSETEEFIHVSKEKRPIKWVFQNPKRLVYATMLLGINALGYYMLIVFIPNQTVSLGKMEASNTYLINSGLLMVILLSTLLAAYLCDFFDKIKIHALGATIIFLISFPLFYSLANLSFTMQMVLMLITAVGLGFCFGPRPLCLISLFPTQTRSTAVALAYNVGNAIFGGLSPLMATVLIEKTNQIQSPYILTMLASFITLLSLWMIKRMLPKAMIKKETWDMVSDSGMR